MNELKQLQPPMTIDEQIKNLTNIGLIIKDEASAKRFLNEVSYFRFVKAYSLGLKDDQHHYLPNVSFEQLVDLYVFDQSLRSLLFPLIENVEITLRSRTSDYFANKYGALAYEDSSHFTDPRYHEQFLYKIHRIIEHSSSPFVKNFKNNYIDGKIPFYALTELFDFGTLSKFVKNLQTADQKAIAKQYGIDHSLLISWIEIVALIRNICAHHGRLYNREFTKKQTLCREHRALSIVEYGLFAPLLCIKLLMSEPVKWYHFVSQLLELCSKHNYVDLNTMYFPSDWYNILINFMLEN